MLDCSFDFQHEVPVAWNDAAPLTITRREVLRMAKRRVVPKRWIVYCVTCTVNGKKYIGETSKTKETRFHQHVKAAKTGKKKGRFQRGILKYGEDNFVTEELFVTDDHITALMAERSLIADYDTFRGRGYNSTSGGELQPGIESERRPPSEAHVAHLRQLAEKNKGKKLSADHIERSRRGLMGHAVSEETRAKISAKAIGRKNNISEDGRRRLGHQKGKKQSDVFRKNLSEKKKAQWADPVWRATRSHEGRKVPERSEAMRAYWSSDRAMHRRKNKSQTDSMFLILLAETEKTQ